MININSKDVENMVLECVSKIISEGMTYDIKNDTISFFSDGEEIGGMTYNVAGFEEIESEYTDSIEDFNPSCMRRFDPFQPIVNVEDIWINRKHQGSGFFKHILNTGFNILFEKYKQFILRAFPENGFPTDKLVSCYEQYGFFPVQETDEDGVIMIRI